MCFPEDLLARTGCGAAKFRYDDVLSLEYANPFFFKLLNCISEWGEKETSLLAIAPQKVYESFRECLDGCIETGETLFDFELSVSFGKRKFTWVLVRAYFIEEESSFFCVVVDVTRQKLREDALRISEETYRIAASHSHILTLRYHIPTRTALLPPEIAQMFNLPTKLRNWPESVDSYPMVLKEDREEYINFYKEMQEGKAHGSLTARLYDASGGLGWYHADFSMIYDFHEAPVCAVVSFKDISAQREKELAYEKWKHLFDAQRDESVGYYEANLSKDIFEKASGVLVEILPEVAGTSFTRITEYVANHIVVSEDRRSYLERFNCAWLLGQYSLGKKDVQFEHRRIDSSGNPYWASAELQMFADPYSDDIKCFAIIKNIDRRKRDLIKLEERSRLDALTGLLNRATTVEEINELLRESSSEQHHVFVMVDIDHFKQLNDNLGHAFGDKVLREIATYLKGTVREHDIVGRLGGDEFVVFLRHMAWGTPLRDKLQTICKSLNRCYAEEFEITGSLGVAFFPQDGQTFEELYLKSDTALYDAKHRGRNQYVIASELAG